MKKPLSAAITILAILLALPVGLILISWNALPSDAAYPTKKWLETVALKIVEKSPLERKLELEYTKRRFSEADQLLIQKGSTLGYTYLSIQAHSAKEKIIEAQDQKAKEDLVTTLAEFSQKLEQRKEEMETVKKPKETKKPTPKTEEIKTIVVQEPEQIIEEIEETQEVIEEIIEELEKEVKETPDTQGEERKETETETEKEEREEKEKEKEAKEEDQKDKDKKEKD